MVAGPFNVGFRVSKSSGRDFRRLLPGIGEQPKDVFFLAPCCQLRQLRAAGDARRLALEVITETCTLYGIDL
jgi:hypothetical protein